MRRKFEMKEIPEQYDDELAFAEGSVASYPFAIRLRQ
jgi:hypothetical protein